MATIKKGILGNFKGKLADLKGYIQSGNGYILERENIDSYSFSPHQVSNQSKFGLISSLISSIYPQLKNTFYYKTVKNQSKFQLLNKLNKDLFGNNLILIPGRLILTSGNLPHGRITSINLLANGTHLFVKMLDINSLLEFGGNRVFFPYMYRSDLKTFFVPKFILYNSSYGLLFKFPYIPENVSIYYYSAYQVIDSKNSSKTFPYYSANSRGVFNYSY